MKQVVEYINWNDFGLAALWYKKSEKTLYQAVIQTDRWVITLVFH